MERLLIAMASVAMALAAGCGSRDAAEEAPRFEMIPVVTEQLAPAVLEDYRTPDDGTTAKQPMVIKDRRTVGESRRRARTKKCTPEDPLCGLAQ